MKLNPSTAAKLLEVLNELIDANPQLAIQRALSHERALRRIQGRGVAVETIIDVGASDGRWSLMARQVWPGARCHLIEAFRHWEPKLNELSAADPAVTYTLAAAGASDGEVNFFNDPANPYGGVASDTASAESWTVPQVSLDGEVARHGLADPLLIKLDTHGFERPILDGAADALKRCSLLVVECYNFQTPENRFAAMTQLIEGLGFRCIDIGEPLFREHDEAFWQIDLFFVPADRPEFDYARYR